MKLLRVIQLSLILIIMMLMLSACSRNNSQMNIATPTILPNSTPTAQSRCGLMIGLDNLIVQACLASEEKYPRRETTQLESPQGISVEFKTSVTEYESRDRRQTKFEFPDGTTETAMIVISPTVFLRQGNQWETIPLQRFWDAHVMPIPKLSANAITFDLITVPDLTAKKPTNVSTQQVGVETFHGVSTQIYETNWTDGTDQSGTMKVWIGSDGLTYKSHSFTKDGFGESTVLVTYEYDPSIRVETPFTVQQ